MPEPGAGPLNRTRSWPQIHPGRAPMMHEGAIPMTLHKSLASAIALAVLIPGAALAHHGWSSYDAEKTLTVTGPLTDVAWRNPHGEAKISYAGKTWAVVLAPVAR